MGARKSLCSCARCTRRLVEFHAVLHRIGDLRIGGHHDDGALAVGIALELLQQIQHHGRIVGIQSSGRLVGDDHFSLAAQRTSDGHATLVQFAYFADCQSGRHFIEAHALEQFAGDHRLRLEEVAV